MGVARIHTDASGVRVNLETEAPVEHGLLKDRDAIPCHPLGIAHKNRGRMACAPGELCHPAQDGPWHGFPTLEDVRLVAP
jgi:hypothetical protein